MTKVIGLRIEEKVKNSKLEKYVDTSYTALLGD